MDGVLVEVTESYHETTVQTVKHFTGETISRDLILSYKNQGGWNNDWDLVQRLVADRGIHVPYDRVVEEFNRIFLGHNGTEGLIHREVWFDTKGVLERLQQTFNLAIFTGRVTYEAEPTLRRNAQNLLFDPIVCADHVIHGKPHPEGLIRIRDTYPNLPIWYLGDTVDDARASRAAHVPFIGICARNHGRREETIRLFQQENAVAILDDITQLVEPQSPLAPYL